tara:strand:- start:176 stop:460 length:285 start_codon:yes stop_codon:yes gene_type:complete
MAKKKKEFKLLTDEQQKQLDDMVNGMLEIAADVVKEYDELDLTELQALSGSITQIHEDSPFLDGVFKGNSWKRVITNMNKSNKKNIQGDKDNDS